VKQILILSRKNEDNEAARLHNQGNRSPASNPTRSFRKISTSTTRAPTGPPPMAAESYAAAMKMVLMSLVLAMIVGIAPQSCLCATFPPASSRS